MAKRMRFSVVGLPHYTIWHIYEPSADDLKHMERMEEERKSREAAEKAEKERQAKLMENYDDPKAQWEQDKKQIENAVTEAKNAEEKEKNLVGGEAGPHAHAGEGEAQGKSGNEPAPQVGGQPGLN
jgi:mannan polymerase II complex ANP1 subunit